jgi:hypothetical protein
MSDVRHEQPVGYARLEVLQDGGLALRHRDGQHLTLGSPKLDHVGAVDLRAEDHDAVFALRHRPSVELEVGKRAALAT